LNLKDITRIVGNSILPPKRSSLVSFKNINQLKSALQLQENRQIQIKTDIPADVLKELYPSPVEQVTPIQEVQPEPAPAVEESAPVVEEVEPIAEESEFVTDEVKPKRKRKNGSTEQ
jgi:hypothetical protein